jgi:hypothetical protein
MSAIEPTRGSDWWCFMQIRSLSLALLVVLPVLLAVVPIAQAAGPKFSRGHSKSKFVTSTLHTKPVFRSVAPGFSKGVTLRAQKYSKPVRARAKFPEFALPNTRFSRDIAFKPISAAAQATAAKSIAKSRSMVGVANRAVHVRTGIYSTGRK